MKNNSETKKKYRLIPRRGVEPRSPAWQAGILAIIHQRKWPTRRMTGAGDGRPMPQSPSISAFTVLENWWNCHGCAYSLMAGWAWSALTLAELADQLNSQFPVKHTGYTGVYLFAVCSTQGDQKWWKPPLFTYWMNQHLLNLPFSGR